MLLKSGYFSFYVVTNFVFSCYATSQPLTFDNELNVTRGSYDTFTNPRCHPAIRPCQSNCDNLGAARCVAEDCLQCQCGKSHTTFRPVVGLDRSDGKCVGNNKFAFSSVDRNRSFLVYQKENNVCMYPLADLYVSANPTSCKVADTKQQWIWTKNKQLLSFHTLKCLQMSDVSSKILNLGTYPRVFLNSCNASNPRQIWQCDDDGLFFLTDYVKKYMNFGNVLKYVILFTEKGSYSVWRRYQDLDNTSLLTLCSHISSYNGCYRYTDGSAMFIIDTTKGCTLPSGQCVNQKDIEAPIETTNYQCSVQLNKTQFFNYSVWDQLPFTDEIFTIIKRNNNKLTLNLDLANLSEKWYGQIIRLYIRCAGETQEETHCVLIKFSGEFKTLFWTHSKTSTSPATDPLVSTGAPPETDATDADQGVTQPSRNSEKQSEDSASTVLVTVLVCLVVILLVVAGIVVYVFYKRKRRQNQKSSQVITKADRVITSSPVSDHTAETLNPIYSGEADDSRDTNQAYEEPLDGFASECRLYEPTVDHEYQYIDHKNEVSPQPPENTVYDYATNDDNKPTVQR